MELKFYEYIKRKYINSYSFLQQTNKKNETLVAYIGTLRTSFNKLWEKYNIIN